MTALELINIEFPVPELFPVDIDFLDEKLEGGLELGQLITITGEQESGKTKMLEQILSNLSNNHKSLYFSLEFNKRQVRSYFLNKLRMKQITERALSNIIIITSDMIEPNLNNIIGAINQHIVSDDIKFIGLDSTLMLYAEQLSGEPEVTEIFRQLHQITVSQNVVLFTITQGSKQDNRDNRVSIFGSQKANHFANMMIHLTFDREKDERYFVLSKNKQNGKYTKQQVRFNADLTFAKYYFVDDYKKTDKELQKDKSNNLIEESSPGDVIEFQSGFKFTIEDSSLLTKEEDERMKDLESKGLKFE